MSENQDNAQLKDSAIEHGAQSVVDIPLSATQEIIVDDSINFKANIDLSSVVNSLKGLDKNISLNSQVRKDVANNIGSLAGHYSGVADRLVNNSAQTTGSSSNSSVRDAINNIFTKHVGSNPGQKINSTEKMASAIQAIQDAHNLLVNNFSQETLASVSLAKKPIKVQNALTPLIDSLQKALGNIGSNVEIGSLNSIAKSKVSINTGSVQSKVSDHLAHIKEVTEQAYRQFTDSLTNNSFERSVASNLKRKTPQAGLSYLQEATKGQSNPELIKYLDSKQSKIAAYDVENSIDANGKPELVSMSIDRPYRKKERDKKVVLIADDYAEKLDDAYARTNNPIFKTVKEQLHEEAKTSKPMPRAEFNKQMLKTMDETRKEAEVVSWFGNTSGSFISDDRKTAEGTKRAAAAMGMESLDSFKSRDLAKEFKDLILKGNNIKGQDLSSALDILGLTDGVAHGASADSTGTRRAAQLLEEVKQAKAAGSVNAFPGADMFFTALSTAGLGSQIRAVKSDKTEGLDISDLAVSLASDINLPDNFKDRDLIGMPGVAAYAEDRRQETFSRIKMRVGKKAVESVAAAAANVPEQTSGEVYSFMLGEGNKADTTQAQGLGSSTAKPKGGRVHIASDLLTEKSIMGAMPERKKIFNGEEAYTAIPNITVADNSNAKLAESGLDLALDQITLGMNEALYKQSSHYDYKDAYGVSKTAKSAIPVEKYRTKAKAEFEKYMPILQKNIGSNISKEPFGHLNIDSMRETFSQMIDFSFPDSQVFHENLIPTAGNTKAFGNVISGLSDAVRKSVIGGFNNPSGLNSVTLNTQAFNTEYGKVLEDTGIEDFQKFTDHKFLKPEPRKTNLKSLSIKSVGAIIGEAFINPIEEKKNALNAVSSIKSYREDYDNNSIKAPLKPSRESNISGIFGPFLTELGISRGNDFETNPQIIESLAAQNISPIIADISPEYIAKNKNINKYEHQAVIGGFIGKPDFLGTKAVGGGTTVPIIIDNKKPVSPIRNTVNGEELSLRNIHEPQFGGSTALGWIGQLALYMQALPDKVRNNAMMGLNIGDGEGKPSLVSATYSQLRNDTGATGKIIRQVEALVKSLNTTQATKFVQVDGSSNADILAKPASSLVYDELEARMADLSINPGSTAKSQKVDSLKNYVKNNYGVTGKFHTESFLSAITGNSSDAAIRHNGLSGLAVSGGLNPELSGHLQKLWPDLSNEHLMAGSFADGMEEVKKAMQNTLAFDGNDRPADVEREFNKAFSSVFAQEPKHDTPVRQRIQDFLAKANTDSRNIGIQNNTYDAFNEINKFTGLKHATSMFTPSLGGGNSLNFFDSGNGSSNGRPPGTPNDLKIDIEFQRRWANRNKAKYFSTMLQKTELEQNSSIPEDFNSGNLETDKPEPGQLNKLASTAALHFDRWQNSESVLRAYDQIDKILKSRDTDLQKSIAERVLKLTSLSSALSTAKSPEDRAALRVDITKLRDSLRLSGFKDEDFNRFNVGDISDKASGKGSRAENKEIKAIKEEEDSFQSSKVEAIIGSLNPGEEFYNYARKQKTSASNTAAMSKIMMDAIDMDSSVPVEDKEKAKESYRSSYNTAIRKEAIISQLLPEEPKYLSPEAALNNIKQSRDATATQHINNMMMAQTEANMFGLTPELLNSAASSSSALNRLGIQPEAKGVSLLETIENIRNPFEASKELASIGKQANISELGQNSSGFDSIKRQMQYTDALKLDLQNILAGENAFVKLGRAIETDRGIIQALQKELESTNLSPEIRQATEVKLRQHKGSYEENLVSLEGLNSKSIKDLDPLSRVYTPESSEAITEGKTLKLREKQNAAWSKAAELRTSMDQGDYSVIPEAIKVLEEFTKLGMSKDNPSMPLSKERVVNALVARDADSGTLIENKMNLTPTAHMKEFQSATKTLNNISEGNNVAGIGVFDTLHAKEQQALGTIKELKAAFAETGHIDVTTAEGQLEELNKSIRVAINSLQELRESGAGQDLIKSRQKSISSQISEYEEKARSVAKSDKEKFLNPTMWETQKNLIYKKDANGKETGSYMQEEAAIKLQAVEANSRIEALGPKASYADYNNAIKWAKEVKQRGIDTSNHPGLMSEMEIKGHAKSNNKTYFEDASFAEQLVDLANWQLQWAGATAVTQGFSTALYGGFGAAREFEASMKDVELISVASSTQIGLLKDKVLELGSSFKVPVKELADGLIILGQAGFKASESLTMIQPISQLAIATGSTHKEASDVTTSVLMSYDKPVSATADITNTLAAATIESKLELGALGTTFNYIASTAAMAGLSIEETTTAMGLMSNAGVRASTIGTSLRSILGAIIAPTDRFKAELGRIGISSDELNPRTHNFGETLTKLHAAGFSTENAFEGMSKREAGALSTLLGQSDKWGEFKGKVTGTDRAETMAFGQMDTFDAQYAKLKNNTTVVGIKAYEGSMEPLKYSAMVLSKVMATAGEALDSPIGKAAAAIGTTAIAATSVSVVLASLAATVKTIKPAVSEGLAQAWSGSSAYDKHKQGKGKTEQGGQLELFPSAQQDNRLDRAKRAAIGDRLSKFMSSMSLASVDGTAASISKPTGIITDNSHRSKIGAGIASLVGTIFDPKAIAASAVIMGAGGLYLWQKRKADRTNELAAASYTNDFLAGTSETLDTAVRQAPMLRNYRGKTSELSSYQSALVGTGMITAYDADGNIINPYAKNRQDIARIANSDNFDVNIRAQGLKSYIRNVQQPRHIKEVMLATNARLRNPKDINTEEGKQQIQMATDELLAAIKQSNLTYDEQGSDAFLGKSLGFSAVDNTVRRKVNEKLEVARLDPNRKEVENSANKQFFMETAAEQRRIERFNSPTLSRTDRNANEFLASKQLAVLNQVQGSAEMQGVLKNDKYLSNKLTDLMENYNNAPTIETKTTAFNEYVDVLKNSAQTSRLKEVRDIDKTIADSEAEYKGTGGLIKSRERTRVAYEKYIGSDVDNVTSEASATIAKRQFTEKAMLKGESMGKALTELSMGEKELNDLSGDKTSDAYKRKLQEVTALRLEVENLSKDIKQLQTQSVLFNIKGLDPALYSTMKDLRFPAKFANEDKNAVMPYISSTVFKEYRTGASSLEAHYGELKDQAIMSNNEVAKKRLDLAWKIDVEDLGETLIAKATAKVKEANAKLEAAMGGELKLNTVGIKLNTDTKVFDIGLRASKAKEEALLSGREVLKAAPTTTLVGPDQKQKSQKYNIQSSAIEYNAVDIAKYSADRNLIDETDAEMAKLHASGKGNSQTYNESIRAAEEARVQGIKNAYATTAPGLDYKVPLYKSEVVEATSSTAQFAQVLTRPGNKFDVPKTINDILAVPEEAPTSTKLALIESEKKYQQARIDASTNAIQTIRKHIEDEIRLREKLIDKIKDTEDKRRDATKDLAGLQKDLYKAAGIDTKRDSGTVINEQKDIISMAERFKSEGKFDKVLELKARFTENAREVIGGGYSSGTSIKMAELVSDFKDIVNAAGGNYSTELREKLDKTNDIPINKANLDLLVNNTRASISSAVGLTDSEKAIQLKRFNERVEASGSDPAAMKNLMRVESENKQLTAPVDGVEAFKGLINTIPELKAQFDDLIPTLQELNGGLPKAAGREVTPTKESLTTMIGGKDVASALGLDSLSDSDLPKIKHRRSNKGELGSYDSDANMLEYSDVKSLKHELRHVYQKKTGMTFNGSDAEQKMAAEFDAVKASGVAEEELQRRFGLGSNADASNLTSDQRSILMNSNEASTYRNRKVFSYAEDFRAAHPNFRKTVSEYGHAILPPVMGAYGAVWAGAAATPESAGTGTVPAAVAGGALMYGAGKQTMRAVDTAMGIGEKPKSTAGHFAQAAFDVLEGAAFETVGMVGGKTVEWAYPHVKAFAGKAYNMAKPSIETFAGSIKKPLLKEDFTKMKLYHGDKGGKLASGEDVFSTEIEKAFFMSPSKEFSALPVYGGIPSGGLMQASLKSDTRIFDFRNATKGQWKNIASKMEKIKAAKPAEYGNIDIPEYIKGMKSGQWENLEKGLGRDALEGLKFDGATIIEGMSAKPLTDEAGKMVLDSAGKGILKHSDPIVNLALFNKNKIKSLSTLYTNNAGGGFNQAGRELANYQGITGMARNIEASLVGSSVVRPVAGSLGIASGLNYELGQLEQQSELSKSLEDYYFSQKEESKAGSLAEYFGIKHEAKKPRMSKQQVALSKHIGLLPTYEPTKQPLTGDAAITEYRRISGLYHENELTPQQQLDMTMEKGAVQGRVANEQAVAKMVAARQTEAKTEPIYKARMAKDDIVSSSTSDSGLSLDDMRTKMNTMQQPFEILETKGIKGLEKFYKKQGLDNPKAKAAEMNAKWLAFGGKESMSSGPNVLSDNVIGVGNASNRPNIEDINMPAKSAETFANGLTKINMGDFMDGVDLRSVKPDGFEGKGFKGRTIAGNSFSVGGETPQADSIRANLKAMQQDPKMQAKMFSLAENKAPEGQLAELTNSATMAPSGSMDQIVASNDKLTAALDNLRLSIDKVNLNATASKTDNTTSGQPISVSVNAPISVSTATTGNSTSQDVAPIVTKICNDFFNNEFNTRFTQAINTVSV